MYRSIETVSNQRKSRTARNALAQATVRSPHGSLLQRGCGLQRCTKWSRIPMDYNFFNRFVCVFLLLFDGYINVREDLGCFFFYVRSIREKIWACPKLGTDRITVDINLLSERTRFCILFWRISCVSFYGWFFICWISSSVIWYVVVVPVMNKVQ